MKWCKSQRDLTICRYSIMPLDWKPIYGYSLDAQLVTESKYPIIGFQSRFMMGYAKKACWSNLYSKMAASLNRVYSQKGLLQESLPSMQNQSYCIFCPCTHSAWSTWLQPSLSVSSLIGSSTSSRSLSLRLPGVLPTMQGTPVLLASNLNPEVGHMVCA